MKVSIKTRYSEIWYTFDTQYLQIRSRSLMMTIVITNFHTANG